MERRDPEELKRLAGVCRRQAAATGNADTKRILTVIAEDYEKLIERATTPPK